MAVQRKTLEAYGVCEIKKVIEQKHFHPEIFKNANQNLVIISETRKTHWQIPHGTYSKLCYSGVGTPTFRSSLPEFIPF